MYKFENIIQFNKEYYNYLKKIIIYLKIKV